MPRSASSLHRPRGLPPRARSPLACALLALSLGAGCGGGGEARRPVVERLDLEPTIATAARPEAVQVLARSWPTDPLPEGWQPIDTEVRLVPTGPPTQRGAKVGIRILQPEGRLTVPVPASAAGFNQVLVHLGGESEVPVAMRLRSGKRFIAFMPEQSILLEPGVNVMRFDVGNVAAGPYPVTFVDLLFPRRAKGLVVLGVDWLQSPLSRWLPGLDDDDQMVAVGTEQRPAVALERDVPLGTTFHADEDATLEFDFGHPATLGALGPGATLELTLTGSGGVTRVASWPLEDSESWHHRSVALTEFAGQEVQATFRLYGIPLTALGPPFVARRERAPRTIVLITSDTHRADHMGMAKRGVVVRTPFLDELGRRGVYFEDCAASTNITNPSHATLMTAISPRDTGMTGNLVPLSGAAVTLAESFRAAGYVCLAAVSANHLEPGQSGLGQGFDRFYYPEGPPHDAPEGIAKVHEWLADVEGLPTFVWLHVFDVHGPYSPPEEYRRLYYPADRDPLDPSLPELPIEQRNPWEEGVRDPEWSPAQYRSGVTYVDDQLRRFFGHPRIAASTFAFTSDHGESLGDGSMYYTHSNLVPATLFVPLILGWPGAPAGTRIARPVELRDVGRTLLDLAGLQGAEFPGVDLLDGQSPGTELRFAISNHGLSASVMTDKWFLRLHLQQHGDAKGRVFVQHLTELFDLDRDRMALDDVAEANEDVARRLRALLVAWLASAQILEQTATSSGAVSQEKLEQLNALGYTGDMPTGGEGALFDPGCECEQCLRWR